MSSQSFQDELNDLIPTKEEKLSSLTEYATFDAEMDFKAIKKELKFKIQQEDFSIRKNGIYKISISHPHNEIYNCNAAYYFERHDLVIRNKTKLGFITLESKPIYVTDYLINDKQKFEIYNNHLKSLCSKEDITYEFIVTSTNRPIAGIPGRVYYSDTVSSYQTYHVRIIATMNFKLNK